MSLTVRGFCVAQWKKKTLLSRLVFGVFLSAKKHERFFFNKMMQELLNCVCSTEKRRKE